MAEWEKTRGGWNDRSHKVLNRLICRCVRVFHYDICLLRSLFRRQFAQLVENSHFAWNNTLNSRYGFRLSLFAERQVAHDVTSAHMIRFYYLYMHDSATWLVCFFILWTKFVTLQWKSSLSCNFMSKIAHFVWAKSFFFYEHNFVPPLIITKQSTSIPPGVCCYNDASVCVCVRARGNLLQSYVFAITTLAHSIAPGPYKTLNFSASLKQKAICWCCLALHAAERTITSDACEHKCTCFSSYYASPCWRNNAKGTQTRFIFPFCLAHFCERVPDWRWMACRPTIHCNRTLFVFVMCDATQTADDWWHSLFSYEWRDNEWYFCGRGVECQGKLVNGLFWTMNEVDVHFSRMNYLRLQFLLGILHVDHLTRKSIFFPHIRAYTALYSLADRRQQSDTTESTENRESQRNEHKRLCGLIRLCDLPTTDPHKR